MRPHLLTTPLCFLLAGGPAAPDRTPDGFRVARPGYRFAFPRDHGAHPEFRTEWWYVTGHLWTPAGRRFGFQLTFFRQASPLRPYRGTEAWRSDQLHLAHAALTDAEEGGFRSAERFQREGLMAGAAREGLAVFNGPWRLEATGPDRFRLRMAVQGAQLDLDLASPTPPVVFGEDGVSRKGDDPTAASHYVTFPRLGASGALVLRGQRLPVTGLAWMDHEFSSNQLTRDQVGWDWAALQLNDGRSLMAYRLRRQDGSQDPWSTLSEVDSTGLLVRATRVFTLRGAGAWTSPATGATYPQPMELGAWGTTWRLVPLLPDQELRTPRSTGITYWEGACRVLDAQGHEVGAAYLEQTGYAHSLQGRF